MAIPMLFSAPAPAPANAATPPANAATPRANAGPPPEPDVAAPPGNWWHASYNLVQRLILNWTWTDEQDMDTVLRKVKSFGEELQDTNNRVRQLAESVRNCEKKIEAIMGAIESFDLASARRTGELVESVKNVDRKLDAIVAHQYAASG